MKNKSIVFIVLALVLGVLTLIVVTYIQMKEPLSRVFDNAEKISKNQSLTDSLFTVYNLDSKEKTVINLNNKSTILAFKSLKEDNLSKDIDFIKQLNSKNHNIKIILNDTMNYSSNFNFLKGMPIYYCDTFSLPFKHKKLLYPYSVKVEKSLITEIKLGGLEGIINN